MSEIGERSTHFQCRSAPCGPREDGRPWAGRWALGSPEAGRLLRRADGERPGGAAGERGGGALPCSTPIMGPLIPEGLSPSRGSLPAFLPPLRVPFAFAPLPLPGNTHPVSWGTLAGLFLPPHFFGSLPSPARNLPQLFSDCFPLACRPDMNRLLLCPLSGFLLGRPRAPGWRRPQEGAEERRGPRANERSHSTQSRTLTDLWGWGCSGSG